MLPGERACPFCAETIKVDALKCRHCGEFLDAEATAGAEQPPAPPDLAPTDEIGSSSPPARQMWAWALGAGVVGLGILLAVSVVAIRSDEGSDAPRRTGSADSSPRESSQAQVTSIPEAASSVPRSVPTAVTGSASSAPLVVRSPPSGGYTVELPETWVYRDVTGGGADHAAHLWYDPADPLQKIEVILSGCAGCVRNPEDLNDTSERPERVLEPGISWTQVTPTRVAFRKFDTTNPNPDDGIVVLLTNGYAKADLWLPTDRHAQATGILNSFDPNDEQCYGDSPEHFCGE